MEVELVVLLFELVIGVRKRRNLGWFYIFDLIKWVYVVVINCDDEDWYCRRFGESKEFCFG